MLVYAYNRCSGEVMNSVSRHYLHSINMRLCPLVPLSPNLSTPALLAHPFPRFGQVTIVPVMEIPEDLAPMDFFWKFMENRGWSFIRNADYTHALPSALPKTFAIQEFHNDIYRSMGGFARVHRVLKRPKSLEGRLFFEFKWGYFFFAHSEDQFDLWSDKRLFRSWARVKVLVEEVSASPPLPGTSLVSGASLSRVRKCGVRANLDVAPTHSHTPARSGPLEGHTLIGQTNIGVLPHLFSSCEGKSFQRVYV